MDYLLAFEFFILGVFTGLMLLSDLIELVEKRAKRGNRP
jgi:hypothetical protein